MTTQSGQLIQDLALACGGAFKALGVPVQAVYLFGSWGTPFQRADSDMDLALLAASPLDLELRMCIERELRQHMALPESIDIVDLRQADTVFAAHAVAEGRCILIIDLDSMERFEMLALSRYAKLNEERSDILADIRARGTVYGSGASA